LRRAKPQRRTTGRQGAAIIAKANSPRATVELQKKRNEATPRSSRCFPLPWLYQKRKNFAFGGGVECWRQRADEHRTIYLIQI
jgi:hypothetical protein